MKTFEEYWKEYKKILKRNIKKKGAKRVWSDAQAEIGTPEIDCNECINHSLKSTENICSLCLHGNPNFGNHFVMVDSNLINNYRSALPKDIKKGTEIYVFGNNKQYYKVIVEKVLRPLDKDEAYIADNDVTYGLRGSFIKVKK